MVSRGRLFPARFAIDCYRRQTWPHRELVIVSAAPDSELPVFLATLGDPTIRYVTAAPGPLGTLRNMSVEAARGAVLCQWDDDDLSHPQRLEFQYTQLVAGRVGAHFLSRLLLWWPEERRLAISSRRLWECSMLCRRLALPGYPAIPRREDTLMVKDMRLSGNRTSYTDQPFAYCYIAHGGNLSSARHLARVFEKATVTFRPDEYEMKLESFAGMFPVHAYREELRRFQRNI
jgi:glycosyltransferase involved in cell wall biosynthesis